MKKQAEELFEALTIAKYFLFLANKENKEITNKKLQKLVYYAQAWHLVLHDKPLFKEDIEAWVHGPAIRSLYAEYKGNGFGPISEKGIKSSIITKKSTKEFLNEIWDIYGRYDAGYLELLSHSEKPWLEARAGLDDYESSNNVISTNTMKEFYKSLLIKVSQAKQIND